MNSAPRCGCAPPIRTCTSRSPTRFQATGDADSRRRGVSPAVQLRPQQTDYRYSLAIALRQAGDYGGAIEELRRVIREQPGNADAHAAIGRCVPFRLRPRRR